MKILYGITKSNLGGAQRYVLELAVEAKKQKHDVVVLCGQNGKLVEKLREENIKVTTLDSLDRDISLIKEFKSFGKITKFLKKEKPDVFHINSSKMGGLGALAGRLMGVKKIIFTSHGWAFNGPRSEWQKILIKYFTWLTILLSHKTICVSEKTKNDISNLPFIKNKLVVIYNGIKEFGVNEREDKSFTVGTIAELHKIKGLDVLLTAWTKFKKKHEAKLVIIGDGEERQNLENMAKNMGIIDSIKFKGFVDNARLLLGGFDIFCLPSRSEGMPYALLEAGVAGKAIIATSVGGIPEIIESGTNGVLIPPDNPEVLFSTLVLLAQDKSLRERLGSNLKASIQEKFSFEQMSVKTFALYL
ncbi:MAG: glycosyltransferase family 4 protein [Patescibacteria group bacterium]